MTLKTCCYIKYMILIWKAKQINQTKKSDDPKKLLLLITACLSDVFLKTKSVTKRVTVLLFDTERPWYSLGWKTTLYKSVSTKVNLESDIRKHSISCIPAFSFFFFLLYFLTVEIVTNWMNKEMELKKLNAKLSQDIFTRSSKLHWFYRSTDESSSPRLTNFTLMHTVRLKWRNKLA